MSEPRRSEEAAAIEPGANNNAATLLDDVERALNRQELDTATALLVSATAAIATVADQPRVLARAMWLAGLISIAKGNIDEFEEHAAAAIDGFRLASDDAAAFAVVEARAEIHGRLRADLEVRTTGAAGLMDELGRQLERVFQRARENRAWQVVNRDRAQLAELIAMPADERGNPLPLMELLRIFELGPMDAQLVALLAPLASSSAQAAAARELCGEDFAAAGISARGLAQLCFPDPEQQAVAVDRFAPRAPLVRDGLVRVVVAGSPGEQRVALDPSIVWFLRGTPLAATVADQGVSVSDVRETGIAVEPALAGCVRELAGVLSAPLALPVVISGLRGAGKFTVVLAAAAQAERLVIVVRLGEIAAEQREQALLTAIRDAFLHQAVLYVVGASCYPQLVEAHVATAGLRLVIAEDTASAGPAHNMMFPRLQRRRADIGYVAVPELAVLEQTAAWQRALVAHGESELPADEIEARLVRVGLSVGDVVESVSAAVAQCLVSGQPMSADAAASALDARLHGQIASLAEGIDVARYSVLTSEALTPATLDALHAVVDDVTRGVAIPDTWGLGLAPSLIPNHSVLRLEGGTDVLHLAIAARLADGLSSSLYRLDIGDVLRLGTAQACQHLRALVASAACACAVVLLTGADILLTQSPGIIVDTLGGLIAIPIATVLVASVGVSELPHPIESRLRARLRLATVDGARGGPQ